MKEELNSDPYRIFFDGESLGGGGAEVPPGYGNPQTPLFGTPFRDPSGTSKFLPLGNPSRTPEIPLPGQNFRRVRDRGNSVTVGVSGGILGV